MRNPGDDKDGLVEVLCLLVLLAAAMVPIGIVGGLIAWTLSKGVGL